MTRRNNLTKHTARAGATDQWRSRWLIPLVPAALGAVILLAAAIAGHVLSGLAWCAVLSAIGVLSRVGRQLEAARRGPRDDEDEREALINTRAMSIVGTLLVIAITGAAAFTLARGESASPYLVLLAVGGISYAVSLLVLRNRSP